MRTLDWDTLDTRERKAALARPHLMAQAGALNTAAEIIDRVKRDGDAALRALTQRFDGVDLEHFSVSAEEFAEARGALTDTQTEALMRSVDNVRAFHRAQVMHGYALETEPGVRCEQLVRPIGSVGLYVPAGSAPMPSAVVMLAVPAGLAGCPLRVLCTPPMPGGGAHPAVLVAAQLCGIDTVFKIGGAQAIAALAYGTQTVPKVDKIAGPGNVWVTAAKDLVSRDPHGAACDLPAGPSEVLVIADETARAEFVAADLLAQAEHDPLSQALLVTVSTELARRVAETIAETLPRLRRRSVLAQSLLACRCIVVPSMDVAFEIANAYAPEHLLIQVHDPRQWLPQVLNAGSVFLGPWSAEPLGDYCSGTNHVLPTYGHARSRSGLSVRDFVKTFSVQEVSRAGLRSLGPAAVTLAHLEGLDAHAYAIEQRLVASAGAGP